MTPPAAQTTAPAQRAGEALTRSMGHVVRILITAQDVRTDEVAAAVGMPRRTLYRKLSGATDFTAPEVASLAAYFEVSPSVFFDSPDELLERIRKPGFFPLSVHEDQLVAAA